MGVKEYIKQILRELFVFVHSLKVPYCPHVHSTARIGVRNRIANPDNLYMGPKCTLKCDSVILNDRAKFIMKDGSGSAEELLVITGNHMSIVGKDLKMVTNKVKDIEDIHKEYDKDVVVEEDVWIGARVTILSGVHIGRGSEIGAGSVLRSSVPPYSVVFGNPAKIVGFRFTPEEIIEHEKVLYSEEYRIGQEMLEKNYKKYYLDRIKNIRNFIRL